MKTITGIEITAKANKKQKSYMKRLFFIALIAISLNTLAQTKVTVGADGNYHAIKLDSAHSRASDTGKFFTDAKGVQYPVMLSVNGKLFYVRTAKTSGKKYNVYLLN